MFQAGLIDNENSDRLQIALEPEAASIYCKSLRLNHFLGENEKTDVKMGAGTVYMVVDAGGNCSIPLNWSTLTSDHYFTVLPLQNEKPTYIHQFIFTHLKRLCSVSATHKFK